LTSANRRRLGRIALAVAALAPFLVSCGPSSVTLVAAGDVASCTTTVDSRTADLVGYIGGQVATLGDNVYERGTLGEFRYCWAPTWGRYDRRVHPSPGNHEYLSLAGGYFDYFGSRAGRRGYGYYHYDLGAWRVLSMNSEANIAAQVPWLKQVAAGRDCVLAYWHRPFRSSGPHGGDGRVRPLWEAAFDAGVDVVLNGHDHTYERFARLGRSGSPDRRGIREFVVGTGGRALYRFGPLVAGSEARTDRHHGVLKLSLGRGGYSWRFVAIGSYSDTGSDSCR
jgi:Calcineurin-like phosphoesterase